MTVEQYDSEVREIVHDLGHWIINQTYWYPDDKYTKQQAIEAFANRNKKPKTATETIKVAAELAEETLNRAEEKGLTIAEALAIPEMMKNIILNELRKQGNPYKREKPRT